uniref:Protein Abitram n=1 Tax=Clastoptera arizonana TaxID=38151 RepID=A0A1B6C9I2_9HEMI
MEILPIEKSFNSSQEYQDVCTRYYTSRYSIDVSEKYSDFCILFHSNKICVITLAPSHPIIAEKKDIVKIDFKVSSNVDRLTNKVSGKGKHGAQILQPLSPLFFVECSDKSKYTMYSCISGKLIEINDNLVQNPNLLVQNPMDKGYIAIVLPPIRHGEKYRDQLLTPEKYKEEILKRNQQCSV